MYINIKHRITNDKHWPSIQSVLASRLDVKKAEKAFIASSFRHIKTLDAIFETVVGAINTDNNLLLLISKQAEFLNIHIEPRIEFTSYKNFFRWSRDFLISFENVVRSSATVGRNFSNYSQ